MRWYVASLLHWFLRETDFITMIKKLSDVYFIFIHFVIKESIGRVVILWFGSKFGKNWLEWIWRFFFFAFSVWFRKHNSFFILCFHIKKIFFMSSVNRKNGSKFFFKKNLKCKTVKLYYLIRLDCNTKKISGFERNVHKHPHTCIVMLFGYNHTHIYIYVWVFPWSILCV